MLSNTASIPVLAGNYVTLDRIRRPSDPAKRRTKIICTIGPACWSTDAMEALMDQGMNVARFNFSHGDHASHATVLERLRSVAKEQKRNIAVLLDTKGPEIRTGYFEEGVDQIELKKGDTMDLTTDYTFRGNAHKLACSYPSLAKSVQSGQTILIADGSLVLTVLATDEVAGIVSCRVENKCKLGERKNMNLPGVIVDLPTFTDKDRDDIVNFGIHHKVDFIAASFVRKPTDVQNLRQLLNEHGGNDIQIISKIENQEGLENYDAILEWTDGVMVARGDLGMEIPPSKVFLAQKLMIRKANIAGKPVITATQMLESMITNPRPTRAECSDVANAVYDGTDAVMLSGETANGPYFEQAIAVMARCCVEAEGSRNFNHLYQSVRNTIVNTRGRMSMGESLASSAVKTALDIQARLILVMSESGRMANYVAKFRPAASILCVTPSETAARQASGVLQGVHTVVVDSLLQSEELIEEVGTELIAGRFAKEGDTMVVLAGRMAGMKEQLKVVTLERGQTYGHIQADGKSFFFCRTMLLNYSRSMSL